jgi:hypothetical protein
MTTSDALKEEQDTPQSQDRAQRERSTILFPYQDLADAIKVAKGVHTLGGSSCQTDQLAAQLGHTVTSGAFQQRLNTARIFGLLTNSRGMVTLTMLGTQIVDPLQQRAAKVESFLNVPLYKKVYDQFKGASLPPASGLDATIVGFGVSPKQKETARRVFTRSAELAGFFEIAKDRLTYPSLKGGGESTSPPLNEDDHLGGDGKKKTINGGGGGNGGDGHHPLIEGLIKALPESGADWPLEARRKWLQAAAMNFDFVYADPTDSQASIRVSLDKEISAK